MITGFLDKAHRAFFESGCAQIINHYGVEHQLLTLSEECGELVQASAMALKKERPIRAHDLILEELADVQVVAAQMMLAMPAEDRQRVIEIALYKVKRQLERIEEQDSITGA